jgi:hypothetical protein
VHNVVVEIYAPLEVVLDHDNTAFEAGHLRYRVIAGSKAALRHATLDIFDRTDVIGGRRGGSVRKRIRLPIRTAKPHQRGFAIDGVIQIAGAGAISMSLKVGDEPVQWAELTDYAANGRSARLALYEVIDPELKILRERLFPQDNSGKSGFEVAIGRLFVLSGAQADVFTGDRRHAPLRIDRAK